MNVLAALEDAGIQSPEDLAFCEPVDLQEVF